MALDTRATGPAEITAMRELWAGLQNAALERAERERAEGLERAPEVKLGPAASAMERRAMREAEAEGHEYEPVTERGRRVHEARALRERLGELQREVRERAELARERYALAREEGLGRVGAGLAGAPGGGGGGTGKGRRSGARSPRTCASGCGRVLGREAERGPEVEPKRQAGRDRARNDGRSLMERLRAVLDGARSGPRGRELRTDAEERAAERDRERERRRELGWGQNLGSGVR